MGRAINNSIVGRFKDSMLEAILAAFSATLIAVLAAEYSNLPKALQRLLSLLDITSQFLRLSIFAARVSSDPFWVLLANVVFYSTVVFFILFLSSGGGRLSGRASAKEFLRRAFPSRLTPKDSNIPSLALPLDSGILSRHLALLPIFQWAGALRDIQVSTLRCRGKKRSTFEISLCSGLIAKVYACDRRDVYEFMVALKHAGFDPEAEFSIPQPLAYLPEMRLLLQEEVEGTPAAEVFNYGDEGRPGEAAERCARWLARFHVLAPRSGRISDPDRFIRRSESKGLLIAREGGSLAAKSRELLDGLKAARFAVGEASTCAGHGDYGASNIILGAGRTVVIDWDSYNVADPARDVARFLVSLEHRALQHRGSVRALDNAAEVFLRAYLASNGQSQALRHLPFYKAAFCLKSASCDLYKGPRPRPDWAEAMLDAGLGYLEGANICQLF